MADKTSIQFEERPITLGQERLELNEPTGQQSGEGFLWSVANLINQIEELKQFGKMHPTMAGEIARWCATAQTHLEACADMAAKAFRLADKMGYNEKLKAATAKKYEQGHSGL